MLVFQTVTRWLYAKQVRGVKGLAYNLITIHYPIGTIMNVMDTTFRQPLNIVCSFCKNRAISCFLAPSISYIQWVDESSYR